MSDSEHSEVYSADQTQSINVMQLGQDNYLPIEDYGLIGNLRTVAMVGKNGSIDWYCTPRFDSPSVFARTLDAEKGGYFRIAPYGRALLKQFYWPDTNVLVTRFLSSEGVGEIIDFMPILEGTEPHDSSIIRNVRVVRGSLRFRLECFPAFNFARDSHELVTSSGGVCFKSNTGSMSLASPNIDFKQEGSGVIAEFELHEDQACTFQLMVSEETDICAMPLSESEADKAFHDTVDYWRRWISKCTYRGRWREIVERSAFALKLLTYEPTGAIVAAPTCSLPEDLGGVRNWDYRYTWIRDAAFTVYAFLRVGFTEEAAKFMGWIEARCGELAEDGSLQIMYGIDGRHELEEETLDHLSGYKNSKPVRVGNGAYGQLQLDIYGELLDAVYLYNKHGSPISYDLWKHLSKLIDWVCDNWKKTDEGIWEVRGGQQHFVYSKLMCWVALDRGLRLAHKRSFPADHAKWTAVRDEIYKDIMDNGWNEERQAFVQAYGGTSLDAANLMMPLVLFVSPNEPKMLKTIEAICKPPSKGGLVSNSLVYRYDPEHTDDGIAGGEGTFNICTFWLVEALTRAGRSDHHYLDEARLIFEKMLGYANHLGLYAEETSSRGEALGNFPQAFTHLALISSAYNLDRALGKK